MQTVNISDFRANLLKYLEIANAGEQISVTSNGKLLATVSAPVDRRALARTQLTALAATAKLGDVISPTDSKWEAQQ
jgi:prevent-host-death family protein